MLLLLVYELRQAMAVAKLIRVVVTLAYFMDILPNVLASFINITGHRKLPYKGMLSVTVDILCHAKTQWSLAISAVYIHAEIISAI